MPQKLVRSVCIGNRVSNGYDIKIHEPNGDDFYYRFRIENGAEIVSRVLPFYLKRLQNDVSFDALPLSVKEEHDRALKN